MFPTAYRRIFISNDPRKDREDPVAKITCLRLLTSTAVKCWLLVKCEKGQNSALLRVRNPPQLPKLPSKCFQDGDSCLNALWTPQYLWYLFRSARASFTTFGSLLRQKSGSLIQSLTTVVTGPEYLCQIILCMINNTNQNSWTAKPACGIN